MQKTYLASTGQTWTWALPKRLNLGVALVDRWAEKNARRPALIEPRTRGEARITSYGELAALSNRLSNLLSHSGIRQGDRVAILLPQGLHAVLAHVAAYKLGAVALPLSLLFGLDALIDRLQRGKAKMLITTGAEAERVALIRDQLPDFFTVITLDGKGPGALDGQTMLARASEHLSLPITAADDPALMIFTSGTTGRAKPAVLAHRVLAGHQPCLDLVHDKLGRSGDLMWTPADWAWAGGLFNALMPALAAGVPVLAHRFEKFDPEEALHLMARYQVTNAFLPPTALKMMRPLGFLREKFSLQLRAIGAAGEALGRETYLWAKEAFGFAVNEFYGQTECNAVIGSAHQKGIGRPGAIGKPIPGHQVALLGKDGLPVAPGIVGEIAVKRPDPVMFLGYAGESDATEAKFSGDWMRTGDQAVADEDGYITFIGREDDLITSAGYRIGPGDIEDCLTTHEAVRQAVVIGKPDPIRTEIVKAFIVLHEGFTADDNLTAALKAHVRNRLSAHEAPREIAYVPSIALTASGKIIRKDFRQRAIEEIIKS